MKSRHLALTAALTAALTSTLYVQSSQASEPPEIITRSDPEFREASPFTCGVKHGLILKGMPYSTSRRSLQIYKARSWRNVLYFMAAVCPDSISVLGMSEAFLDSIDPRRNYRDPE